MSRVRVLLRGLRRDILNALHRSHLGVDRRNKVKILSICLLQSVPPTLRRRSRTLNLEITRFSDQACRHSVVRVGATQFALVDLESLEVISPEFESFMVQWFAPKEGDVLVDVGAHIGKYSLPVARIVGENGKVVGLEPHPLNCSILRRNISLNRLSNVIALNVAAWKADNGIDLFIGQRGGHHSTKVFSDRGSIRVRAKKVDSIVAELGLNHVDWIKIDVEGAEYEVLLGSEETLRSHRPRVVAEISEENVTRVKRLMAKYGYDSRAISPFYASSRAQYFLFVPIGSNKLGKLRYYSE